MEIKCCIIWLVEYVIQKQILESARASKDDVFWCSAKERIYESSWRLLFAFFVITSKLSLHKISRNHRVMKGVEGALRFRKQEISEVNFVVVSLNFEYCKKNFKSWKHLNLSGTDIYRKIKFCSFVLG